MQKGLSGKKIGMSQIFQENGKVIPVTWKKKKSTTKWYTSDGSEIKLNPGKTWISVYGSKDGVTFE